MNDEDDASETERAEAEALARALDGDGGADAPEDALSAALFLRHGGARGELAPDRAEQILQRVLRDEPRMHVRRLSLAGAALAAAAALLLWLSGLDARKSAPAPDVIATVAVPAASASLLAAQADLVRQGATPGAQDPAAVQRFDRELRAYRAQVLRALQAAYPAPVGTLEPSRRPR